jgi:quinolinate synthase
MSAVLEAIRPIEDYLVMPDAEIAECIEEARKELGEKVIILGHHYQREDVIAHADLTGDSYQLSVMASQTDADFIVFCGVHFMAESADHRVCGPAPKLPASPRMRPPVAPWPAWPPPPAASNSARA